MPDTGTSSDRYRSKEEQAMRTGVRHRFVRSHAGRVIRPLAWVAAAALIALSVVSPAAVGAATPPQPTHGSATVDGATGDWNLGGDKFADMTDAGSATQPVVAHLYLRYDCASETLYALVLGINGTQFRQTRPENAYIRINGVGKAVSGNSGNNGVPPDFSWVNPDGTLADGFEGSLPLAPGTYTIRAHVLRPDNSDDKYQTVDNIGRADPLELICQTATPTPTGEVQPTATATATATATPTATPTGETEATATPTATPSSGQVQGATATPRVTLPPTATIGSTEPPTVSLSMIFLGLGLIIAGALFLLDKPKLAAGRRRRE
jgi:hypothetical protein